jgi:hypothetical protein
VPGAWLLPPSTPLNLVPRAQAVGFSVCCARLLPPPTPLNLVPRALLGSVSAARCCGLNHPTPHRCQHADWKAHKKDCLTTTERLTRVRDAVLDIMPAAQERWDSRTVLKLGRRCMHDFTLARWGNPSVQDEVEIELYELMSRAYSRDGQFEESIDFAQREIVLCKKLGLWQRSGRGHSNIAGMLVGLHRYADARVSYETVHTIGEKCGSFELYAKSNLGLSKVAYREGNLVDAKRFAQESLTATGLYQPGQYGKSRDEANAILAIVACCNVESESFDGTLLDRLAVLGEEVDEDTREGGGSFIGIRAAALLGRRHLAMGRIASGVAAYQRVVEIAKEQRFLGMAEVQNIATHANLALCNLALSGLLV